MLTEDQMCLRVDVQRALSSLPEDERRIVHLIAMAGLTAREAAALVGLPTMSLHDKYRRALWRLRYRLSVHAPQVSPAARKLVQNRPEKAPTIWRPTKGAR